MARSTTLRLFTCPSSTSQGGGGSFKKSKPTRRRDWQSKNTSVSNSSADKLTNRLTDEVPNFFPLTIVCNQSPYGSFSGTPNTPFKHPLNFTYTYSNYRHFLIHAALGHRIPGGAPKESTSAKKLGFFLTSQNVCKQKEIQSSVTKSTLPK